MLSAEAIRLYRQFLFDNADVPEPLPPGLIAMHERFWAMLYRYGQRSALSTEVLVYCTLLWQQTTKDGQRFMAGCVEDEPIQTLPMSVKQLQTQWDNYTTEIDWKEVSKGTRVVVQRKGETRHGEFRFVSGKAIQVLLDGEKKPLACSPKTTVLSVSERPQDVGHESEGNQAVG